MSILKLQQEINDYKTQIKEKKQQHLLEIQTMEEELKSMQETLNLVVLGIDNERYQKANNLLNVKFEKNKIEISLIEKAIIDISKGITDLKHNYYGMKRYDGYFQESNHPYGYGPKHGYIVQSVGLKKRDINYSIEDVEDMLYLLLIIKINKGFNPKGSDEK